MVSVATSRAFVQPEDRKEPVVINSHMFQDSIPALPGGTNGVGGSATVHARQALELGNQNVLVAPSGNPLNSIEKLRKLPAITYAFQGNTATSHDSWYNKEEFNFLVERVLGAATNRDDILYAHMPISGEASLAHAKMHGNPLVYLGHAWELLSVGYFPDREIKGVRLLTEYKVLKHLAEGKGPGVIVTNTQWEANAIAGLYSRLPDPALIGEMVRRCSKQDLSPSQQAVLENTIREIQREVGTPPDQDKIKAVCIPNPIGVDLHNFNPASRRVLREDARNVFLEQRGWDPSVVILGSLGRLHPQKDQIRTLDVFNALWERMGRPDHLRLALLGPGDVSSEGEAQGYFGRVNTTLEQRYPHLSRYTYIPGRAEDPHKANAIFDIRIDTARFETWGLSLQEALAMGVPTVATANPVYKELYEQTPLIVEQDHNRLVDALTDIIRNPRRREEYGQACYEVGKRHDWEHSVAQLGSRVFNQFGLDLNGREARGAGRI